MTSASLYHVRHLSRVQLRDLLRFGLRRLTEERLPQIAGSLTFTSVLALVPVLTIALAIFTTFPLFNTFRTSLEAYFFRSLIPPSIANTILANLNQFAAKASRLSAVGAVLLMATAFLMIAMVDRTFNQIWRVRTRRPVAQRLIVYWAVITLGPLLLGISFSVTAYVTAAANDVVGQLPFASSIFYTIISLLATTTGFTLLYVVVPNRLVEWRDAACGGLLAAVALEITKRGFAVFVAQFPSYTMVYGALAAVPIFLVWIYLSWMIILMGAVLAAALPIVKYERWWHVAAPGSAFVDAMALLGVLYESRVLSGSAAVDAETLRSRTRLGFDESELLLQRMLDSGWVGRIRRDRVRRVQFGKRIVDGMDRWTLLVNPDQLTLADVYRLFVFGASENIALAKRVESAVEQGLSQSLASYFAGQVKTKSVLSASAST